jgi:uncharacterized membrane protein HdeD (DUF308 family)
MFGVQNLGGPDWILPATPFAQGLIAAGAGLLLLRSSDNPKYPTGSVVVPGIAALIQLFGVYFIVSGLVGLAGSLSRVVLLNEVSSRSVNGSFASAIASVIAGVILVARPVWIAGLMPPDSQHT